MKPQPLLIALGSLHGLASAYAQIPAELLIAVEPTVIALVTDAYDGDTISVEAAVWPDLTWEGNVRVLGVDTPEIRGDCESEKSRALMARDFVRDLLIDESVFLTGVEADKYGGRVLAHVWLENGGGNLAHLLVEHGHARAYDGGTREGWCGDAIKPEPDEPAADEPASGSPYDDPTHPLAKWDDNRNGRISCAEAEAHGIAPVYSWHPAYPYMTDRNNDGVVCE